MEIFEIYGEQKTLTQWDLGRKMQVHVPCQQLHFANEGAQEALVSPVEETGGVLTARIPDEVLQQSGPLWVYAFVEAEEGYTKRIRSFFVKERPQPAGYVYTPTQWVKLENVMARMDALEGRPETDPTVPAWAKQPQKPAYTAVEVGARPDHWIPTPVQIGAAPAGYGLGVCGAIYTSDLNTCIQNGWYYTNEATRNVPHAYFQEASVLVMGRTSTYIVQKLTSIYYRSIMMRYTTDGGATWVEEWVEPPMAVGVEYRTAERFEGKPVYAKLIDFGALPNATYKTVSLGTTNGQKIVYCHAVTSTGVALPYVDTSGTAAGWMMRVKNAGASAVTIETTGNYSTITVCVFVKYTKATD